MKMQRMGGYVRMVSGDLIRNEIAVPFTKGQDEKAKLLEEMIKSKPQLQDIVINKNNL